MLSVRNLHHSAADRTLFAGVELNINRADKLALTGHNGSGKSTLLHLLAGRDEPLAGEIQRRRGLHMALVEQFLPPALAEGSVEQAVLRALPAEQQGSDGWRAAAMLASLGFSDEQLALPVAALSGGQENRLMLARALVSAPDLLLLDEPSNHMDVATVQWLEGFLRDTVPCAFVLISHDRALLDACCSRTAIVRDQRLYCFDLPFSRARQALAEQDLAAAVTRKAEERRIAALRASAKRLAEWGSTFDNEKFARRARNMARRADRMDADKTFVSAGQRLQLDLGTDSSRANRMLALRDLAIHPGGGSNGPQLLHIDELVLRPGERVALLGANGVGKSSLITRLVQHWRNAREDTGRIAFSPQAELGYYDQDLAELDVTASMVDWVAARSGKSQQAAKAALIHAGFPFAVHDTTLGRLSGGERARVLFAVLALLRPNFLILDEPTNHVDIEGREQLEEQLLGSEATILVTSHDRRFVERVAERILVVADGTVRESHDPDAFYRRLVVDGTATGSAALQPPDRHAEAGPAAATATADAAVAVAAADEEQALARLLALDDMLAADRARKPRHQKPERQAAWQAERDRLAERLGL